METELLHISQGGQGGELCGPRQLWGAGHPCSCRTQQACSSALGQAVGGSSAYASCLPGTCFIVGGFFMPLISNISK